MSTITIRYWAGARDAAGVESETVCADTISQAMDMVAQARPEDAEFRRVMGLSSLLRDGQRVSGEDRLQPLAGDVELEVLPPFAGG